MTDRGNDSSYGDSIACGPLPAQLRHNWQYLEARKAQFSFWTEQA